MYAYQTVLYLALQRLDRPLKQVLPSCTVPFRAEQLIMNRQVSDMELLSTKLSRSLEGHSPGHCLPSSETFLQGDTQALEKGNADAPVPTEKGTGQSEGFLKVLCLIRTIKSIQNGNNYNCFRFIVLHQQKIHGTEKLKSLDLNSLLGNGIQGGNVRNLIKAVFFKCTFHYEIRRKEEKSYLKDKPNSSQTDLHPISLGTNTLNTQGSIQLNDRTTHIVT